MRLGFGRTADQQPLTLGPNLPGILFLGVEAADDGLLQLVVLDDVLEGFLGPPP